MKKIFILSLFVSILLFLPTSAENVNQENFEVIEPVTENTTTNNNENENIIEEINNVSQDIANYKGYCDGLIQNLGLHSVEELKGFVNELILKKNIDRKRVHKLKKVLVGNVD